MTNSLKPNSEIKVMIVDDDANVRRMVRLLFERDGYQVVEATNGKEGVELYQKLQPSVILMDIAMPEMDGLTACKKIRETPTDIPILLVTSLSDVDSIEKGFAAGATDYITKPLNWIVLKQRTLHLSRISQAEKTVASLQQWEQIHNYTNSQEKNENLLIGSGEAFSEIHQLIRRAASTDATVLITGETGTGKNVIAKAIHHTSEGRRKAFISINCAALPESLIEAELFGVEKGAYTGATSSRKGLFELANDGTLFLDEIGEMPVLLQSKLLSVLEERKVRRLGAENYKDINVRIIAATNVNPKQAIENGKLRSDLFYRLSVINIQIPALRQRSEDIAQLCYHFIKKFAPTRNLFLSDQELDLLKKYSWPGNVRELRNIIERCIILQPGPELQPSKLISNFESKDNHSEESENLVIENRIFTLEELEKQYIEKIYNQLGKNQTHTAQALNISLTTLKRKLKDYKISLHSGSVKLDTKKRVKEL
ncbi:MAG: sigma-54-dependent Fis family transcriptional regulator [Blastocatellia bacterium]|nr:sigma-54-dependent Fis family transcriptional regulator [Blastocatellia bacterium]MBN8723806.1 sigma-54-dependent Fis family transcriptional regulator [Acidobacteriota bacterium]